MNRRGDLSSDRCHLNGSAALIEDEDFRPRHKQGVFDLQVLAVDIRTPFDGFENLSWRSQLGRGL